AAHPTAAAPGASGADAVIETVATARVTAGDNLWNISRTRLGEGMRYTQIYAANSDQIRDPNLIYPGQVFVVPSR
ncbi:MAG: LysM peptidoglycan-binding domain-containing protein, partial [Beijerinckiaceae bacterium]|nr:LysM peptidoglycan-binding domain-containing protein [Beijerinckiaceae bacterium]